MTDDEIMAIAIEADRQDRQPEIDAQAIEED